MYNPMTRCFLSYPLFHQGLFGSEEFHRQLVVGRLKERLQLVLDETLFARLSCAQRRWAVLFRRCAIEGDIIHTKMHLKINYEKLFIVY